MSEIDKINFKPSFSTYIKEIEQITADMMAGNISNIETMLLRFERGVSLIQESKTVLKNIQQEIDQFIKHGTSQVKPDLQEGVPHLDQLEKNMEDLRKITVHMESSEVNDIEQVLTDFKKGISLVQQSQALLNRAEQKISILTENNEVISLEKFLLEIDL